MWRGEEAWFSPDGTRIAYVPNLLWQTSWKRYRGGQTTPIYIVRLSDLTLEKVPRENSNDSHPIWLDRKSTRLNSSHLVISYAVFCLKKKKEPMPASCCCRCSACSAG